MKIQTPLEFQTFNDGIVNIYHTDDSGNKEVSAYLSNIPFSSRVVGTQRYYAAAQHNIEISDIIRIPLVPDISTYDIIESDSTLYEIKRIQQLNDTNPSCIQLTLQKAVI